MSTTSTPSREFFDLIKAIGEAKSKQDEDRTINAEIRILKARMSGTDVSKKKMQEYVIRMMYCELLGHPAEFGYIHSVNMCQAENVMQKRIGYLACCLLLDAEHELIILLVNTIQRDLKSTNHLKVCAALTACCKLINGETLPAVVDMVTELLDHPREIVRKKAVIALHRFVQLSPDLATQLDAKFRRALCDKDPSVMSAALCVYRHVVEDETARAGLKDIVPSIVSILKQVADHRLPREYDYHRVPAPWTQIKLLQILATLGQDDQASSEGMYGILEQIMRTANNNLSIGFAVTYECVRTIARIYPNHGLIETAAATITTMISSNNQNLKYLGITGLAELVKVSPKYAAQHQLAVIDCLEDPDDSLKRKTLDLLYRMTSPQNVLVITDKLLSYLEHTTDMYLREELVSRVTLLAERYAPDNSWFINTMNVVFELGGDLVRPETAHNLVRLIAEGSDDDDEADNELRHHAVLAYLDLLEKRSLPDILIKTIAWVVGEYAYLVEETGEWSPEEVEDRLCRLIERDYISMDARAWGISALAKLIAAHGGYASPHTLSAIRRFKASADTEVQERCFELESLLQSPGVMGTVLPLDASCEDIEVDLSFLNAYVDTATAQGAAPYLSQDEREDLDLDVGQGRRGSQGPKLKMASYPVPDEGRPVAAAPVPEARAVEPAAPVTLGDLGAGVKRKWGRGGYHTDRAADAVPTTTTTTTTTTTAPAPAPAAEPEPVYEPEPDAPEPPRQLSERERLAASLFGGGDESPTRAGRGRGRTGRGRTRGRGSGARTSKPLAEPEPEEPAPAVPPAAAPGPSNMDLLGDIFGGVSAPQPIQPMPKAAQPSFDDDLLSLQQPAVAGLEDLLSPVSGGGVHGAMQGLPAPQAIGAIEPTQMPVTPLVSGVIGDCTRQPATGSTTLTTDHRILVTQFKAFCPDMLAVVLSVASHGPSDLSNVSVTCTTPPELRMDYTSDPDPESQEVSAAKWRSLPSHTRVLHVLRMTCAPLAPSGLKVTIGYQDEMKTGRVMSATIPLSIGDMLRPHTAMKTADFSTQWTSFTAEKRSRINGTTLSGSAEYATRIEERCHLRAIETIGTEVIAAGVLAGTDDVCLVHGNVTGGLVVVTVRSKNKKFSDVLAQFLQQVLS